jgi:hypothetical protein
MKIVDFINCKTVRDPKRIVTQKSGSNKNSEKHDNNKR